jgi:hypothetical protein
MNQGIQRVSFSSAEEAELHAESPRLRPAYDRWQPGSCRTGQISDDRDLGAEGRRSLRADEGTAHADIDQDATSRALRRSFPRNWKVHGNTRVAALVWHEYRLLYGRVGLSRNG